MAGEYKTTDKVSYVLANDYRLLQVMSRFGISFGFGEKSIKEICQQKDVDADTFIAVINYVKDGAKNSPIVLGDLSVRSLLDYLRQTHAYFLDYQFPTMRRNMLNAIDCSVKNEVAFLVLKFFDSYVEEVRKHMEYEEKVTFSYVEKLLSGDNALLADNANHLLSKHHESIDRKLRELKNLFIQYYPQKGVDNELNAVIYELYRTQEDLEVHCRVEDNLFTPAVRRLAYLNKTRQEQDELLALENDSQMADETLSEREKEIVVCVAKGMANKEIADSLCISVNTVTTHRRNIARKLSIHSSAGITIYAIVNKLVTLEEVNV
jgi:regulator of cell morphogenesis and NO signaling